MNFSSHGPAGNLRLAVASIGVAMKQLEIAWSLHDVVEPGDEVPAPAAATKLSIGHARKAEVFLQRNDLKLGEIDNISRCRS